MPTNRRTNNDTPRSPSQPLLQQGRTRHPAGLACVDGSTITVRVQRSLGRPASTADLVADSGNTRAQPMASNQVAASASPATAESPSLGFGGYGGGPGEEGVPEAGHRRSGVALSEPGRATGTGGAMSRWVGGADGSTSGDQRGEQGCGGGEPGAWFNSPMSQTDHNRSRENNISTGWTRAWEDGLAKGVIGKAQQQVAPIESLVRPATPPRMMQRLGGMRSAVAGIRKSGDELSGGPDNFGRGGAAGKDVDGQCRKNSIEGVVSSKQVVVAMGHCTGGHEEGGAEVTGNIAKKLDFHDIFA